jgi:multidrug efflux pump subunit AcrB
MTLGGMALAVGILVDDSTVTIENTHRLRGEGMSLAAATLHGSAGIAVPTLVSTLAISCVFTSVVFLEGPAKFLFTPLGLAVVFAMLASYTLSRTLTPVIIGLLLKGEHHDATPGSGNWFSRFHQGFERAFERFRRGYVGALTLLLKRRWIVPVVATLILALGGVMLNFVGRDFFPAIDGGQIKLHVRALELGLNAQAIANDLNISLSSSEQVSPNFWTDPTNGIPYYIAVQTPEHQESSLCELRDTPVSTTIASAGPPIPGLLSNAVMSQSQAIPNIPGLLSNVATLQRDITPTNLNQTNIQPVYDIYAAVQGRDLGSVSDDISRIVAELEKELKPGNTIQVLGQIQSMNDSFRDLTIGLLFAAVFVYMLMVVNYQNFGDPFVVILALPATLCGIVTMLFITGTTLNVPSLMGAIMAVGVASANSILLVTFAREQQLAGRTAFRAAIDAGHTRIRPVLMTAAAMIVGMIPMAIGGAGEEQNAALARAVIGGLLFATPTTLPVVPYLFAMLRKRNDGVPAHGVFEDLPDE